MFAMAPVVCALLPRFQLTVAAGDRAELLKAPVALGPAGGLGPSPLWHGPLALCRGGRGHPRPCPPAGGRVRRAGRGGRLPGLDASCAAAGPADAGRAA